MWSELLTVMHEWNDVTVNVVGVADCHVHG